MTIQPPKVVLRIGSHAEKEYFEQMARFLDGMMFGGNLLEITPAATFSLVYAVGKKRGATLPFFLDPMTYCFGPYIDPTSGRKRIDLNALKSKRKDRKTKKEIFAVKDSYTALASNLGSAFEAAVKHGAAVDISVVTPSERDKMCKGVVDYQMLRMGQIRAVEVEIDDEEKDALAAVDKPAVVFAPYFFIHESWAKDGLDAAIDLARRTAALKPEVPVHAVVCADHAVLRSAAHVQYLITHLPTTGIGGVWLWFDGFSEHEAPLDELVNFRKLVKGLGGKMEVFNLHGGYYSLLLAHDGLTGISHGVGYGEQKPVAQVIGAAAPTVRYYLPPISKRVGVPDVQRCLPDVGITTAAEFFAKVCGCQICKGVIGNDLARFAAFGEMHRASATAQRDSQTPAAAKMCRFHFLLNRFKEPKAVANLAAADRSKHVTTNAKPWRDCFPLRSHLGAPGERGYIELWAEALNTAM